MRLSGLQREVIKLYRLCLREAGRKPEVSQLQRRASTYDKTHLRLEMRSRLESQSLECSTDVQFNQATRENFREAAR